MPTGAITSYIDVAQLTLYAFWIFFAGLVVYLQRESRREGFPKVPDRFARGRPMSPAGIPAPKTFILAHGGIATAPRVEAPEAEVNATPTGLWPGAPLQPNGNPMLGGVGPAAYAMRNDTPELTTHGEPMIVPLRVATDFYLPVEGPDPVGMPVLGADRAVAGVVSDVWVDRTEVMVRYLEVELAGAGGTVLLPMTLAKVDARRRVVTAKSVLARHFAEAPGIVHPEQVTSREEDRICAYFASGHLYALPSRSEPLL